MKEYHIYLRDMLFHAEEAVGIAHAKGNDRLRKLALERSFVVIAEAAKKIPRDLQPNYPQVPWEDIVILRNNISHGYDEYSLAELETIAKEEVHDIAIILKQIIDQPEE